MQAKPLAKESFEPKTAEILEFPRSVLEEFQQVSTNLSRIPEWQSPKSSTEIAEALAPLHGVDPRTFQRNISNWFLVIKRAYCWFPEGDLRFGIGKLTRYTPFCCQQFETLAQVGKDGYDLWIASVHDSHRDVYQTWLQNRIEQVDEVVDGEIEETPAASTASQGAITVHASQQPIAVHQINQIHLTVINTQPQVDQALANLQSTLSLWNQNSNNLESALVQNAENQGSELGAKVAIAKVSKLVQTSEQVEQALAAQLGLLGKPQTAPAAPQDS